MTDEIEPICLYSNGDGIIVRDGPEFEYDEEDFIAGYQSYADAD